MLLNGSSGEDPPVYHLPVMVGEVVDRLVVDGNGCYVDATLGGGGHAAAILDRLLESGRLIGMDKDLDAVAEARRRFQGIEKAFTIVHSDFSHIDALLDQLGIYKLHGILFDIGLSSFQVDTDRRGFSYRRDGPLDMRIDQSLGKTAADLLNTMSSEELASIFYHYGEERASRRIASAVVARRRIQPLTTTEELSRVIAGSAGGRYYHKAASRVFQALRIAVNDELDVLREALPKAISRLAPGGRIVVISYHSLEDRIVKQTFQLHSSENILSIIDRKPVRPSTGETDVNPRCRSAKLRTAQKT